MTEGDTQTGAPSASGMGAPPVLDIIAGARPNFVKIAPIIRALRDSQRGGGTLSHRLVHTGQHYDDKMSGGFFTQLEIPEPEVNLEVGSGTQSEQTAAIMVRYERLLSDRPARVCVVVGDVTSTMACSIVARKHGMKVAHVEGGLRSGDWSMPEEINRVVTDSIANYFFTTSVLAGENLRRAGVRDAQIFFVGNTMIDTLKVSAGKARPPAFWGDLGLARGEYFVLTLHRPANVDSATALSEMVSAIAIACRGLPVVFPVHPRTAKMLCALTLPLNVKIVEPQGYLEFAYLVQNAKAVLTDSGGVTEETTVLGIPCLTLRDSTERPETVTVGTNELVGTDPAKLAPVLDRLFEGRWKKGGVPENWDGRAGQRIVASLEALARAGDF